MIRGVYASTLAIYGMVFCWGRKVFTLDLERDDGLQGIPRAQRKTARVRRKQLRKEQEKP